MNINNRQSFLGESLDEVLESTIVGIVGLGGGGSQIIQQLAHIGFRNYILCDYDIIEATNLNRLVGSTKIDVDVQIPKIEVATRLIRGLVPDAHIEKIQQEWQLNPEPLKSCNIIFGCLDGFKNRAELESLARRSLVPYIDIGMDVKKISGEPPRMYGQVFASIPGLPCMRCMGLINETVLSDEAHKYGDVGIRPQVIWPNAILASTAVGITMNLLMNWTEQCDEQIIYYEYDGNKNTIKPHMKTGMPKKDCIHYKIENVGDINL